jgi:hypothetical protein
MIEPAVVTHTLVVGPGGSEMKGQTSGAAAQAGTLTNAPKAGAPQFWIPVKIDGVQYWIPAWHA